MDIYPRCVVRHEMVDAFRLEPYLLGLLLYAQSDNCIPGPSSNISLMTVFAIGTNSSEVVSIESVVMFDFLILNPVAAIASLTVIPYPRVTGMATAGC
jgi:hypothetical protein